MFVNQRVIESTPAPLGAKVVRKGYRFTIWRVRRAPARPGIAYDQRPHWVIVPNAQSVNAKVVPVEDGMIEMSERDAIEQVGFLTGLLRARDALRDDGNNSADLKSLNALIALAVANRHARFDPRILR